MSLDKAIASGHEKRHPYRGSKRFDKSCRNHGGCPACEGTRLRYVRQNRQALKDSQCAT